MSHVTTGDLCITDLDAAEVVVNRLGGVLERGKTTFRWFGKWLDDWRDPDRAAAMKGFDPKTFGQCEHTIRLQDATGDDYEIGLVRRADGKGWDALYDVFGPGRRLEERFGLGCGRLKKELGVEMAMQRARRRGYRVQRLTNARGQTQVRVWR